MSAKKGLGRGLGALLGESALQDPMETGGVTTLSIHKVEPNPLQPRKVFDEEELQALADSIEKHGLIQPLTVRQLENGYYQIIAGERRWRASRMAGLSEVPVVVLEADDRKAMELALIENLQRQDLNPVEEALGYQSLIEDYSLTQEQVAQQVGKSRPAVANALRLLQLQEDVLQLVETGILSAGHARALLQLKDQRLQKIAAQKITALDLSVRQTERLCKQMAKEEKPEPEADDTLQPIRVDYYAECERSLAQHLGRGVRIVHGKRKGRFELEYYGQDDLQRLLDLLSSLPTEGGAKL